MPHHGSSRSQTDSDQEKSYCVTADFFLSFSDPTALMILDIVRKKEMSSSAILKKLGIEPNTVAANLKAMERKGILVSFLRSQNVLYRVAAPQIIKAFNRILELPTRNLKRTSSLKRQLSGAMQKRKKPSKTVAGASIR
jgi:DNA-binding transcriptional ArsR family regulator